MRLEQAFGEVIYIVSLDIYFSNLFGWGWVAEFCYIFKLYDNVSFSYFDLYGLSLYSWEGGGSWINTM